ncbi:tRNA (guanosine(37)-N1)-methyltransferase TrmD [Patescibacteria group bacterium]|nr:tRNA (guanosine(37)-N1)-methyltransferase TrmD [Patescibacteria group bacterium]
MKFTIITLFPKEVDTYLKASVLGRAREKKLLEIELINLRDFGIGKHKKVDDTPYGGGPGMLLRPDVVVTAINKVRTKHSKVILLSPEGKVFNQLVARRYFKQEHLVLVCGRFEGFDARIKDYVDEVVSLGSFVLSGGELGAMSIVEATARLIPGVLGNSESALNESFSTEQKLEYPQYTKPQNFEGKPVPDVLLSGHHKNIEKWRA